MKRTLFFIVTFVGLAACQTVKYVPVETVKTEYREVMFRDSIYLQDSIVVKQAGDTVFLEKYRYLYRDKIVRDSVLVVDSIQVAYPVEVERRVNVVSGWQNFQIWLGRILIAIVVGWLVMGWLKKKFGWGK